MKEYSAFAKTISVIFSIILSYFLVIISFKGTILLTKSDDFWGLISFGGSMISIILPIVIAWRIFNFKLRGLLWVFPIIFLLVLIYSPSGFYFLILKVDFYIQSRNQLIGNMELLFLLCFIYFSYLHLVLQKE